MLGLMPKLAPLPSPIVIQPHGARFQIVRAGEVYVVPKEGPDLSGEWHKPDAIPDGFTSELTSREAGLLAPVLRGNKGGRPRSEAATPDGKLIDRACKLLGVNQAGLAAMSGIAPAVLSRARKLTADDGIPLTEQHREKLREMVKQALAG